MTLILHELKDKEQHNTKHKSKTGNRSVTPAMDYKPKVLFLVT